MKPLLYFLTVALISLVFILPFSYASTCTYDISDGEFMIPQYAGLINIVYLGHFDNQQSAFDACYNIQAWNQVSKSCVFSDGVSSVQWFQMLVTGDAMYYATFNAVGSACPGDDGGDGDGDGDGLPDDCDVYPDDPSDYQVKLFSQQLDPGGNVVRECYITDRNDVSCYGDPYSSQNQDYLPVSTSWQSATVLCSYSDNYGPADPAEQDQDGDGVPDGYDDGSSDGSDVDLSGVESKLDNIKSGVDLSNTKLSGIQSGVNSIDSKISGVQSTLNNIKDGVDTANTKLTGIETGVGDVKAGIDTANTKLTGIESGVGEVKTGIDTANTKLTGIETGVGDVKVGIDTANTKLTGIETGVGDVKAGIDTANTKLTGIETGVGDVKTGVDTANTKLTGIGTGIDSVISNTNLTNQNLSIISDHLSLSNGHLSNINDGIAALPTAEDIGQSVKDNLIDPSQTIDTTITDNIPTLDKTDTLTSVKIKCSDRYDLFITTLKGSDLFSLPFGIFTGPSGSGSSIQTVNIGKWGSSTDQTATIDYSNYDNIWDILRSVLLLLTSFACFKILVLKKG